MNPLKKKRERECERKSRCFLRWSEVFLTARLPRRGPVGRGAGQERGGSPDGTVRPSPELSPKGRATSRAGNPTVSLKAPQSAGVRAARSAPRGYLPRGPRVAGWPRPRIPTGGRGHRAPTSLGSGRCGGRGRFPLLLIFVPCFI